MRHIWNIEEQESQCLIWRADGLIKPQIVPRSKLKQQMNPHGVVADIYDNLCLQLDKSGKASVAAIDLTLPNSFNYSSFSN